MLAPFGPPTIKSLATALYIEHPDLQYTVEYTRTCKRNN